MTVGAGKGLPESAWTWLLSALLLLVSGVVYLPSLEGPFLFDDEDALITNGTIRSLPGSLSPPDNSPVTGRPVVNLSFALNFASGGLSPGGYHRVNLGLHGLAAWLLFLTLRRCLRRDRLAPWLAGWQTPMAPTMAPTWVAASAALLWALHPVQTEAVSYVTQRTELAFSVFLLATLYGFLRSLPPADSEPGGSRLWLVLAVLAAWLGAASKEVFVVVPVLVVALDALWITGSWRRAWRVRWRSYLALASCWIPLGILVATGSRDRSAGFGVESLTALDYLRTQAGVVLHYLRLTVWPRPLVVDYDDWPVAETWGAAMPELLLVAALVGLTVWGALRCRRAAFGGVWFFLILAPTSSVLPIATEIAAERRLYLPSAAIVGIAVLGLAALLPRLTGRRPAVVLGLAAVAGTALVLGLGSWERNGLWRDPVELLAHTVEHRAGNARARNNLAAALIAADRQSEAEPHLRRALELAPDEAAHTNLGILLAGRGRWTEAEKHYRRALEIEPESPQTLTNLGLALAAQGRLREAEASYRQSLRLDPGRAETHNNLGSVLWRLDRPRDAVLAFGKAVELAPAYGTARLNLGVALAETGDVEAAVEELAAAARALPEDAEVRLRWASVLARTGRRGEALEALHQAAALDPEVEARLPQYEAALGSGDR